MWVSDKGSHFKNVLMRIIASNFKILPHYVTMYHQCENGTLEICMREILCAAQEPYSIPIALSEAKLAPRNRPKVVN